MKNKSIWVFIIVIFISIIRVIYLQINNHYVIDDNYVYGLTAPRGRILDINGKILVDNKAVKSLVFNGYGLSVDDMIESARALSELINIDFNISNDYLRKYYYILYRDEVNNLVSDNILVKYKERKISSGDLLNYKFSLITDEMLSIINKKEAYLYYLFNNGYYYEDKIIKVNLSDSEYIGINNSKIKGIRTDITWERYYPYGDTLLTVFGNVSSYNQGLPKELKSYYLDKGYNLNDRVGINNLEYIYDDYLRGEKAIYKLNNGYLEKVADEKRGKDIVLSIDIDLQSEIENILEEEMIKAKEEYNTKYYDKSYLIVSDPNTGDIISLVGKKIDNNGNFVDYSYYNILDSYPVGSVVKAASISVGYKYNLIDENFNVKDSCVTLYGQNPKCSWKELGYLDDIEALRMSSNYFQYLIAIKLTGNEYYKGIKLNVTNDDFNKYREIFSEYGLGTLTNIDLSNEVSGIKGSKISDDLLLNYAIGQYDTYTPIQLSSYINTVATGERKKLNLLKYVLNSDGSIYYETPVLVYNSVNLDIKYLNRIRMGLYEVNKSGTGYNYVSHKFSSAGKTGTAESMLGNIATINTSYVMYAPYEEPKFSIVMVSPNIKYQNKVSSYKYPINALVVKRVSDLVYDNVFN